MWNRLESLQPSLDGEEARIATALLSGRPLVGARLATEWTRYAFVFRAELPTFTALMRRARVAGADRTWLQGLHDKRLDLFVAIGRARRAAAAAVINPRRAR